MISRHCGVLLKALHAGQQYIYGEDCKTLERFHEWECSICSTRFQQRIRLSEKVKGEIAKNLARRKGG